ncbi:PLP-dependent aminotransferase family protein [Paenibacillus thermoaerophilus]|uniref:PLP-dependent aminotransferase family protein n=1 Tax=Paenibacillus thermoaerophilus TaxID=1215385 RepID=A0ABW2V3E2_9BACL|nr:PLP-dependent aminotransferase family protein [Paenibacillus thermoaerophilus]TMV18198.1 PLP-dependent aminotransferase family protein [Paenibacillus thermoaerophilus]
MIELTPELDPTSGEPLYLQLYRYIRAEIVFGRIPANVRLPSVRRLAGYLGVSRTPVSLAYEQLAAEGYVVSRPRSGLFAADLAAESEGERRLPMSRTKPAPSGSALPRAYHDGGRNPSAVRYDFGYGRVDLASFPLAKWRRYMNRVLVPENGRVLLYGDLQGEPELRAAVASYLHQIRGVRCEPEQIVIGAGTYHSLDLLLQLLRDDVGTIAAEAAVNDGVIALLRQHRFAVRPLTLEPDGLAVGELADSGAGAVYTTPSHQFPYGMTLSAAKRAKLLQWAEQTGAWIIENDYDGEFRYAGRPIPSLQGKDRHGRVVYLGTFSRALSPAFRLSYLVLPPALLRRFRDRRHSYDQLASPILQRTLQLFMESGDFGRHMRRMRALYRRKHDAFVAAIVRAFGSRVEIVGTGTGLHLVLRVRGAPGEDQLIESALANGVRVYPVSPYSLKPPAPDDDPAVLLGFGGLSERELEEGVSVLTKAWRELLGEA